MSFSNYVYSPLLVINSIIIWGDEKYTLISIARDIYKDIKKIRYAIESNGLIIR